MAEGGKLLWQGYETDIGNMVFEVIGEVVGEVGEEGSNVGEAAAVERGAEGFEKAFPALFPYLDKSTILSCRSVCKAWNVAINTFLQEHPTWKPYDKDADEASRKALLSSSHFPEPLIKNFQGVAFTTLEETQRFLKKWKKVSSEVNPFFERNVTFIQKSTEYSANGTAYWNNVKTILERFGGNIWYLTMDVTPLSPHFAADRNNLEFYDRLGSSLRWTPNLKSLTVYAGTPRESQSLPAVVHMTHLISTFSCIKKRPLPRLDQLTSLEFNSQEVYGPLRDGIVERYLNQLKKLRITVGSPPELVMMNVSELEITCWPDDQMKYPPNFRKFKAPNLKKLTIRLMPRKFSMALLLEMVSCFSSVEYLKLIYMPSHVIKNLKGSPLQMNWYWDVPNGMKFPNVKILEIKMDPGVPLQDCIDACFPEVEQMIIRTTPTEQDSPDKDIWLAMEKEKEFDKALRTGCIHKSVIWQKMPKLKELVHVSEDPFEEMEVGNYGQWENRARWEWSPRPKVNSKIKKFTRDLVQEELPGLLEKCKLKKKTPKGRC